MTILPFGDYAPDTSDFLTGQSAYINNVVPRSDGYGPMPSFTAYSLALNGGFSSGFSSGFSGGTGSQVCRGFFKAIKTDGSVAIFAATSSRLYQLNNATQGWTDVSKSAGYSALSSSDNWQFAQYINDVIAVQANAPPQVFTLGSSTTFGDLAGSPPQARYVSVIGDFVVLTGLTSNPYRVQWSALGDDTGWTSGVNSSDFQDLPDGGIVRGVAGGEYGNIFQDTTIRRMIYAPGSDVIFQIERISEDQGLYCPYSVIRSGDQIFFVSSKGFMQMAPTGYPVPIGKEKVSATFLADLDSSNLQLVIGASDPRHNRVFWAYKSTNGQAGLFDKMICYDYALQRFSPIAMTGEYLGSLSQPGITLENLDTISSSIDALIPSLDSFAISVTPEIAAFNSSHELGFFRGSPLEAKAETAAQEIAPGRRVFVRGFRPITDATSAFGSVGKREALNAAETTSTEATMDARGFVPQRASTRYPRGIVRIPAGTNWTYLSGVEPDFAQEGGR